MSRHKGVNRIAYCAVCAGQPAWAEQRRSVGSALGAVRWQVFTNAGRYIERLFPLASLNGFRRRLSGDQFQIFLLQFILALVPVWIERDAIDRANLLALRGVVVADAFGAQARVDLINFYAL